MHIDHARIRRESIRWIILLALNNARPDWVVDSIVVTTVQGIHPDATELEVRREIDYLTDRQLASVDKTPTNLWCCALTRHGVDVVEYTVDVEPGIARPQYYQQAR